MPCFECQLVKRCTFSVFGVAYCELPRPPGAFAVVEAEGWGFCGGFPYWEFEKKAAPE